MFAPFVNRGMLGALEGRGTVENVAIDRQIFCAAGRIRIRNYRPSDRNAIRRLCCDTGFLGNPVETIFADRELFADLFTKPYLEREPEWALVAEADGRVTGYLLGSVCRNFDWLLMYSGFQTAAKMVFKLATGRYAGHPRSKQFVRWLFTAGMREQPKHPAGAAHLHLDIDKRYRGQGIGRQLWDSYEQRLRHAGVKSCYGAFFSHPARRPETVYARYGFSVYDRKRTTLFQPEMSDSVDVVCVHKEL